MLNIINPEEMSPIFTQLIADFRRTQVSRFPITVTARNFGSLIVFEDSRFPAKNTKVHNIVGTLRDCGLDKNSKQTYEVRSRLINNEKYAQHNDDYYSRTTNDPKKVSKFLKDYFKPFAPNEIAGLTSRKFEGHDDEWRDEFRWKLRDVVAIEPSELFAEVQYLQAHGVEFSQTSLSVSLQKACQCLLNTCVGRTNLARRHMSLSILMNLRKLLLVTSTIPIRVWERCPRTCNNKLLCCVWLRLTHSFPRWA